MTYLVHDQSGKAVSIGTVLADPMPAEYTVVTLDEVSAELLAAGKGIWNPDTLSVDLKPEHLWPQPEGHEETPDDL
jgi:hypothetical protein